MNVKELHTLPGGTSDFKRSMLKAMLATWPECKTSNTYIRMRLPGYRDSDLPDEVNLAYEHILKGVRMESEYVSHAVHTGTFLIHP